MAKQRYDDATQRAYARPDGDAGMTQAASQDDSDKGKGIFSEFSVASVIASSLAAITSFALQRQIGLAGSFIGVGVAAAATAIANQVYKSMLSASAEKLRSISDQDATIPAATPQPGANGAGMGPAGGTYAQGDATLGSPTGYGAADETMMRPVPTTYDADQDVMPESGTPIAPDSLIRAAAQRRHALIRRRATISIVVIALVAALLSAGVVLLATAGHGLGSIESLFSPSPRPTPGVTAPTTAQQGGTDSAEEGAASEEDEAAAGTTAPKRDDADDDTATSAGGSAEEKAGGSASGETSGTTGSGTGAAEKPSTGTSGETTTSGGGSQGGGSSSTGNSSGSTGSGSGSAASGSGGTGSGDAGTGSGTGSAGGSTGTSPSATTTTSNKS